MSTSTVQPVGPVADTERSLAPDLGRGLMLALIALANSAVYLYNRPYGARQHIIETEFLDRLVAFVNTVFVEVRAYPLFAALFGYGVVHAYRRGRAASDDHRARGILRRRGFWLIVFGAVHALVLFSGDILGLYGVLSLILLTMLRLRDRTLLIVGGAWLVLAAVVQGLVYSDSGPNEERAFFWSFTTTEPLAAAGLRVGEWLMTPFGLVGVFSAALAGMWAARHGVLDQPGRHRTLLKRVAAIGVGLSVLGGIPIGTQVAGVWSSTSFGTDYAVSAVHVVTGVAGGLGYAALFGLLAARIGNRPGPVLRAVAACGQRSLSFYLFQSVIFVALFVPYTLGLGGELGSAATAGVALATWLAGVGLAELLRRAGRRGPAETLLRRLSYRRS
ncbi:DUF418 domain-containing protein [Stackebrandtia nassauensis]|uniref:DUF418 domain-containing protein n=1 Tax=Stackebrandtia nassauensis (strain DSM 44728 / CIP 108903 / NRRL B-16338 / NBRC 102104 / LLR-40K-21) TaxID=446470 RepID=D3Q686_STANL|nr:DUF418 domain-containing protein [Stackebrandtia nassauensis]ADD42261.1 protein of unknown function DUF418 [Stackebrandtia nassauensis DSM 44728]